MTGPLQSEMFSAAEQIGAHALAAIFSEAARDILEARGMAVEQRRFPSGQTPLVLATVGFCIGDIVGAITMAFESPRLAEPLVGHEAHRQHVVFYTRALLALVAEAFQAALAERPISCRIGLTKTFVVNELGESINDALAFSVSTFCAEEGTVAVALDLDLPSGPPALGDSSAYSAEPGDPILF